MIYLIMKKYKKYDMRFDYSSKTLFIYDEVLVKDFIDIKNIIKDYEVDVKDIRVKVGR